MTDWKITSAVIVAIIGLIKYFHTRSKELAWRRTEFLFEQSRLLDTDEEYKESIRMLEGRHSVKLETLYDDYEKTKTDKDKIKYYEIMDKLLNYFDRISYSVYDAKTLTIIEVSNFGWYLQKIKDSKLLNKYCEDNGFQDILKLSEDIEKLP